jgi:ABC-type microcin C transport system duplicated ATPase subunit YejF
MSPYSRPKQRQVNIKAAAAQTDAAAVAAPQQQDLRGKDVVMRFYEAYNERDLDTIASLIADDISYHDLVYEEPHDGREGVMQWLNKVGAKV